LMDDDALVQSACREIVELTPDRHSVLIFASGIQHARHIQNLLGEIGYRCGFICGETPALEREKTLKQFKDAELQYLVNVNVLTTGFDAPNIDCVAMLRPTNSPGLYYQCCGRGFRLDPTKDNCLVLDFGGNILRHGPVDALQIKQPGKSGGEAPAKECPQCQAVIHAAYANCPECGYECPPPQREQHERQASEAPILSGEVTETQYEVRDTSYSVHIKRDNPDGPRSMRVEYTIGWQQYISEWICFEHTGYARHKAEQWWRRHSLEPIPDYAYEAVNAACDGRLAECRRITVRHVSGEKYDRIIGYELGEKPEPRVLRDPDPVYMPPDDEIPF